MFFILLKHTLHDYNLDEVYPLLEPIAEIVALGLASWAAYKSRPTRLELDWSFLFHRALGIATEQQDPRWTDPQYKLTSTIAWDDFEQPVFESFLQRKCKHLICFDIQGLISKSIADLPQMRIHSSKDPEPEWIANHVEKKSDRLLIITSGKSTQRQLEMLHKYPGMRDRMFAFVALDPIIDPEWLAAHFNQKEMDAEANHAIPYVLLYTSEPTRTNQIIHEPPVASSGWRSIQVIDLGIIPANINDAKVARSLWVVLSKML